MDKVDYLTFYMIKSKFIFHILKIEVMGKQVHQLRKVNLINKKLSLKIFLGQNLQLTQVTILDQD